MLSPINNSNLPRCNEKTKHSQWRTGPKCACYCALWFMAMAYLCLDVSATKCMRKMDGWVPQLSSSSVPLSSVNKQGWFVESHLNVITSRKGKYVWKNMLFWSDCKNMGWMQYPMFALTHTGYHDCSIQHQYVGSCLLVRTDFCHLN